MPLYAKFLKELINKKRSWQVNETVLLTEECRTLIQKGLPPKLEDPGSFFLPCAIGSMTIKKAMCDLGASINLMPASLVKKLGIKEVKPVQMSLELVDKSVICPSGIIENLLVKVDRFIFPADFVILDSNQDEGDSIILGRPFLATARAIIDIEQGELTLRMHNESITLSVLPETQNSNEKKDGTETDKENLQWREEINKTNNNCPPKQEIDDTAGQKEKETVQSNEEAQGNIVVLATKKRNFKREPVFKEEELTKGRKKNKNRIKKGWKNKKIPTEGLSKGDKVQLVYQQLGTDQQTNDYYTVSKILSLEHAEIEHQGTKKKLTIRGDKLRHYSHQPP